MVGAAFSRDVEAMERDSLRVKVAPILNPLSAHLMPKR